MKWKVNYVVKKISKCNRFFDKQYKQIRPNKAIAIDSKNKKWETLPKINDKPKADAWTVINTKTDPTAARGVKANNATNAATNNNNMKTGTSCRRSTLKWSIWAPTAAAEVASTKEEIIALAVVYVWHILYIPQNITRILCTEFTTVFIIIMYSWCDSVYILHNKHVDRSSVNWINCIQPPEMPEMVSLRSELLNCVSNIFIFL